MKYSCFFLAVLSALVLTAAEPIAPPVESHPETCLSDLQRFPCLEVCKHNHEQAVIHVRWLEAQIGFARWRGFALKPWLEESQERRNLWEWMLEARKEFVEYWEEDEPPRKIPNLESYRIANLDFVRKKIGEAAYRQGLLPAPVPIHRFRLTE